MLKKLPKIIISTFLLVFAFQLIGLAFLLTAPEQSQAIEFIPQVGIDKEFEKGKTKTIDEYSIGKYIQSIYKYAIGIVGILATVVMMFGGVIWITAGGNAERVGNAKSWIGAALTGLVLALTSYLILTTINPDLVNFKPIVVREPPVSEIKRESGADFNQDCDDETPCKSYFSCVDGKCISDCGNRPNYTPCITDKIPEGYCFTRFCYECRKINTSCEGTGTEGGCCSGLECINNQCVDPYSTCETDGGWCTFDTCCHKCCVCNGAFDRCYTSCPVVVFPNTCVEEPSRSRNLP